MVEYLRRKDGGAMTESDIVTTAGVVGVAAHQVEAVRSLLHDGATIPFIARYRKEKTGSLDEIAIAAIRDHLSKLAALDERRAAIIRSLEEQAAITTELRQAIESAATLNALEDIYLPYRPKRRTRALMARERGLEPLAAVILAQEVADPTHEALVFVSIDRGIVSVEEALAGARDIIAERVAEDAGARQQLRGLFVREGIIKSSVVKGREADAVKYADYFDGQDAIDRVPSHRMLAMLRGEKDGFLRLRIRPPEDKALALLHRRFVKSGAAAAQVAMAVEDAYARLLAPSIETDIRERAKERADDEALFVFARNLRDTLMAPALGPRAVLAIDPGYRTGCKVVCLDPQGKLLATAVIYVSQSASQAQEAAQTVRNMVGRFDIEAIAIGNGTAGREADEFIRGLNLPEVSVVMVNESGASIYSASAVAREEFPDQDITVRGAVSIGRRLMDPLAELVKIDPQSIGVGQYQHDVEHRRLKDRLDETVVSCVNEVGVKVNTASQQLLTYVSGLGPTLAKNIITYRNENGPFRTRAELKKVPRLGPKAFEMAAGFLRIDNAVNPLDASAVHPESYHIVDRMARDHGCAVADLMRSEDLRSDINLKSYGDGGIGLPTLRDIMAELSKPGRDPRARFEAVGFAADIRSIDRLAPGMRLGGIVTNVTNFGAFVDVGVHQDGLVHISEMADKFVKNPAEVVRVNQRVSVTVLAIDAARKRISLSMKSA
jgi:uncharacterized protein